MSDKNEPFVHADGKTHCNSSHALRDENGLTHTERMWIARDQKKALLKSIKEKAKEEVERLAKEFVAEWSRKVEEMADFEHEQRDKGQMRDFAYEIANRELSRLNAKSVVHGLNEDEITSLQKLIAMVNQTEKVKSDTGENDGTQQLPGESDDDYRKRLESMA